MEKKICKLVNALFSWILEVDGEEIYFQGRDSAEYFEKLYKKLGYIVLWEEKEDELVI